MAGFVPSFVWELGKQEKGVVHALRKFTSSCQRGKELSHANTRQKLVWPTEAQSIRETEGKAFHSEGMARTRDQKGCAEG